jgi:hypothetical protein
MRRRAGQSDLELDGLNLIRRPGRTRATGGVEFPFLAIAGREN